MFENKNSCLSVATVLGQTYASWLWAGIIAGLMRPSFFGLLGSGLSLTLGLPRLVCISVAVILSWVAHVKQNYSCALYAGIAYICAVVFNPFKILMVIVQLVLCFMAYSQMKKAQVVEVVAVKKEGEQNG